MKTIVEISDALLKEAKKAAARERTTVRALIEQGLRLALQERAAPAKPFRLRRASFRGRGLSAEAKALGWERLREIAYEGRGG